MARHGTRSLTRMQALRHFHSGCPAHTKPGHGSSTAGIHSMRICEPHGAPNSLNSASERVCTHDSSKRGGRQRLLPPLRRALEAHRTGPIGPSGAARAPLFDAIATRCSTASPKPAGSSWWFSAFNRRLRVDLERSTPKSSIPSPIMTVTSTPPWRDHLALIVTARTSPASGCTDARQWVEQKRSTVQRRSALSTALRSAIACAMSAGVANAGAEGALIAIRPSFPARN